MTSSTISPIARPASSNTAGTSPGSEGCAELRAIAACVGLFALIGVAFWFAPGLLNSVEEPELAVEGPSHRTQTVAVLDLRNASQARGGNAPEQATPRLTVPHNARTLQIYLPIGSEEGEYEVGLFRSAGRPLVQTRGRAELISQSVILRIKLDLSLVSQGEYLLGNPPPRFLMALPRDRRRRIMEAGVSRCPTTSGLYSTQWILLHPWPHRTSLGLWLTCGGQHR